MRPTLTALVATLCLVACDGIGAPIVSMVPIVDGGDSRTCEVSPTCRPLRSVEEGRFDVPAIPPDLPTFDCDGDTVDDAIDNCPGVSNTDQDPTACRAAASSCEALRAGTYVNTIDELDPTPTGPDLRGCRIAEPIEIVGELSLRGARMECTELSFVSRAPARLDLTLIPSLGHTRIFARGDGAPLEIDVSRTTLRQSSLVAEGSAHILAHGTIFGDSGIWIGAGGVGDGTPTVALDARASDFSQTTIAEASGPRAGRVRLDRSGVTNSTFSVSALEILGSDVNTSALAAFDLNLSEVTLARVSMRTERGAIASSVCNDVVFEGCGELRVSDSEMTDVDIPVCEPAQLRAFRTEFLGANVGGGLELVESAFRAGVMGGGPASTLLSEESEVDGVRFCDLGAAAFHGGAIRCVTCDEDAFMRGTSVCISGAALFERGCPAIELAPVCGG